MKYFADKVWGYVTLTVDQTTISGRTTEIDRNGNVLNTRDQFSYPAGPIMLATPKAVPTL